VIEKKTRKKIDVQKMKEASMEIVDLIRIIGLTENCSSTTGKLAGNSKPY